ncbi:Pfs, NB-ARC and TPR domain protein [Dactylonectria macrodidyma]|uniref:Pfs, NB-ARC and TPR domain protein n=1 Tax=Dactylonectria macrodidyma TaxID=307937 RepID=A0A9P9DCH3_9HYPO|nr:Pfs, NB-ARC and TPR domain protein [Dactylonectria macrodidyma]
MVGIGGGVPSRVDMRLGDVVVGTRVMQYDLGKIIGDGQIQRTAIPKSPHHLLGTAVSSLQARHERDGSRIPLILEEKFDGHSQYGRPTMTDRLFLSKYDHTSPAPSCDECDRSQLVPRSRRSTDNPVIHYGTIASGNQVMRNGTQRDNIARQLDAICFEMEAAGLMDILPCRPIRGICDYSDSHKNKEWQRYAAATAAAYARELLGVLPVAEVQTKIVPAPNPLPASFQVPFSLQGVPVSDKFIDRPTDRATLEQCLLPQQSPTERRKVCVLHGLGGIGKTQLALDFARRYKAAFSAIFWLDGRSEDQLRQSFARCLTRIPELRTASRNSDMNLNSKEGLDVAVMKVVEWLAQPSNTQWLLIFDNVDQDQQQGGTTGAYDIRQYFPGDQGSILITTRLLRLQQLGRSKHLTNVDQDQSRAILQTWYGKELHWRPDYDTLLDLLQGLPLALAQAASYLRERGMDVATYIQIYNQQWQKLMGSDNPLTDYHQKSIATTWAVSLDAIENKSTDAMNVLRLWACLDNKQFWHGLLKVAKSMDSEEQWPPWLLRMASDVTCFADAMGLLLRYSMIQAQAEPRGSYAMHPVVHRWVLHLDSNEKNRDFARLALILVGHSVPTQETKEYWTLQQRILPHAERCSWWIQEDFSRSDEKAVSDSVVVDSVHRLGILYRHQGKLREAEVMYGRALEGKEKALGRDHTSTLDTVHNLGLLYWDQDKLSEAEAMYGRALEGKEKALGHDHTSTLDTVNNLGLLCRDQDKLGEAEAMLNRALEGYEKALGRDHTSTLDTVNNLGLLYWDQGKLGEAEAMYGRALEGYEKALGRDHMSTLDTVNNLGLLCRDQDKLREAEAIYERALEGKEKALGRDHTSTLETVNNLGVLYRDQGKLGEAEAMLNRALEGREKALGRDHTSTLETVNNLGNLYRTQGRLDRAEAMYERALEGREKALGRDHTSTLDTVNGLGILYRDQSKLGEAEAMLDRALEGFQSTLGPAHQKTQTVTHDLQLLHSSRGEGPPKYDFVCRSPNRNR